MSVLPMGWEKRLLEPPASEVRDVAGDSGAFVQRLPAAAPAASAAVELFGGLFDDEPAGQRGSPWRARRR